MTTGQFQTRNGSILAAHAGRAGEALPNSKWELLKAAEAAREPMGIKRTSLALLRSMIALIRNDQVTADRPEHHICFASNETLAERTHVSVKTVERHIGHLVELGLIERFTTGNGKRWARRDRNGKVTIASGLSLMPLVEKQEELERAGEAHANLTRHAAQMRDHCALLLERLRNITGDQTGLEWLFAKACALFRRKPQANTLSELQNDITEALEACGYVSPQTDKMRDNAPETEGHKETDNIQKVKKETDAQIEVTQADMERSFPKLCAETRLARSYEEGERILDSLARGMGIGQEWPTLKREHGPKVCFMLIGYGLQKINQIQNPRAYLLSLSKKLSSGAMRYSSLITPKPRAMA